MPISRTGLLENIALGTDGQYAGSTGTTALYKTIEADEIATSDDSTVQAKLDGVTSQLADIEAYIDSGVFVGGTYAGVIYSHVFTATAGQTEFTLENADAHLFLVVIENVPQTEGVGYIRTSDIKITLTSGATAEDTITIYYTVATAASGFTIQDEGTPAATRANLNFVGSGVTVSDDETNDRTTVTIESSGGSSAPIATFTQTGNNEVVVTAVDVATGVFTSVGHGLLNNQQCAPILNLDAGKVFLMDKVPTGLYIGTRYVVNKTNDTFQLSATPGGDALTYTTNANMDLTTWHFEVAPGAFTALSGLPPAKKYRVHVRGRAMNKDRTPYLMINAIASASEWEGISFGYQTFYIQNVWSDVYYDIDFNGFLSIYQSGVNIKTSTVSANSIVTAPVALVNVLQTDTDITSIGFSYPSFANGTIVEVYAA